MSRPVRDGFPNNLSLIEQEEELTFELCHAKFKLLLSRLYGPSFLGFGFHTFRTHFWPLKREG